MLNIKRYYNYLKRTGLFAFLSQNFVKLIMALAFFYGVVFAIEFFVIPLKELFHLIVANVNTAAVFFIFTLSESFLGILPPDFFIVWCKQLGDEVKINPWLLVTFLATLSYLGGLISYWIGKNVIVRTTYYKSWHIKYQPLLENLKKWGGFFIVIAALLPVPFSVVMMVCGMVHYPFKWVAYLSLFRYVRFLSYALFLFQLV